MATPLNWNTLRLAALAAISGRRSFASPTWPEMNIRRQSKSIKSRQPRERPKQKNKDPNHDSRGESHATLSCSSKSCSNQLQHVDKYFDESFPTYEIKGMKISQAPGWQHIPCWHLAWSLHGSWPPCCTTENIIVSVSVRFESLNKTWTLFPFAEPLL